MSSETSAASLTGAAIPGTASAAPSDRSAGALLRQAREMNGMTLDTLAALLKVPVRKLEALEEDRHADLQGPTFVRALALAACRAVKTDAAPVLALLPHVQDDTLDRVSPGINKAFQDPGRTRDWRFMLREQRGVLALMLVFALGALILWALPEGWVEQARGGLGAAPAASSVVEEIPPLPVPAPSAEPIASDRLPPAAASAASVPVVPLATPLPALVPLAPAMGGAVTASAVARPSAAGVVPPRAASGVRWGASGVRQVMPRSASPVGTHASGGSATASSGNVSAATNGAIPGAVAPTPVPAPVAASGM